VAGLLTVLPALAIRSPFVLSNIAAFRAFLLISDTVWVTANVTLTGGIRGPFWICYLGVVLFAAVSLKAWQASLFGFAATAGLVVASLLAHTLDQASVPVLVLVGATFPLVAWFNSTLAAAVWELRSQASAERK